MRQNITEKVDNHISNNEDCLLQGKYKQNGTLAENENEKLEEQEAEAIAERYFKAQQNYKLIPRR